MDQCFDAFSLRPVEVVGLNAAMAALEVDLALDSGVYNRRRSGAADDRKPQPAGAPGVRTPAPTIWRRQVLHKEVATTLCESSALARVQVAVSIATSPVAIARQGAAETLLGLLVPRQGRTKISANTFSSAIYRAIDEARQVNRGFLETGHALSPVHDQGFGTLQSNPPVGAVVRGERASVLGSVGLAPTNVVFYLDGVRDRAAEPNLKGHATISLESFTRRLALPVTARALAVYYALADLDLLDQELLTIGGSGFVAIAASPMRDEAARAVFSEAADCLQKVHQKAVSANRLHTQPKAWSRSQSLPVPGVHDHDLLAMMNAHGERVALLEHCGVFLEHAHLRVRDVEERQFFQAILGAVTGADRQRLMRADSALAGAVKVVQRLMQSQLTEAEQLSRALGKIEILQRDHAQRGEALERYERVVAGLHKHIGLLRAENHALAEALRDAETDARRARIGADVLLGLHRVGEGRRQFGVGPVGASAETGPDRARILLDLELAVAMGAGRDQTDLIERASKVGIAVPPREVIERTLDSLRLPIGAPEAAVDSAYRAHMVHFHPDKVQQQSAAQQRLATEETARLNHARDLHKRYHELFGGEA